VRNFEILFDHGERSELPEASFGSYGRLGFPPPPPERPWIFANFVQTVDGVVSLLGNSPSGSDISQSPEDRWLMDLLRAHADAVLLGTGTLRAETALGRPGPRGPVFRIVEPELLKVREKLGHGRERNIFLTSSGKLSLQQYAAFDGQAVDPFLLTTAPTAAALAPQLHASPHVKVIVCGEGKMVELGPAMRLLRQQYGIRYLLCEGGPTMYSNMLLHDLIDEKFLTVSPLEVGLQLPEAESLAPDTAPGTMDGCRSPLRVPLRPTAFALGGLDKEHAIHWQWLSCRKVGDHQFHRFRRLRESR